ncbi:MAG: hypothetical protein CSA22_06050 [Deltaproteobacteria bacterium]|nr:MAG: hypothetical protein CSA22_06050 [Deltaproteobacteria bacterium]
MGKNFFQGVVKNRQTGIGKDAVYNFLNSPTYNWRRFILLMCARIYVHIRQFLKDSSEEDLIVDDSPYDRNRSQKVELLSRAFDHSTQNT